MAPTTTMETRNTEYRVANAGARRTINPAMMRLSGVVTFRLDVTGGVVME